MADNFVAGFGTRIGLEGLATPGVVATPTKSLVSASIVLKPNIKTEQFVPEGGKVASSSSVTEDSSTGTISGEAAWNELQLFFAAAIVGDDGTNTNTALAPTAGTPTTAKIWDFALKLDAPDTARSLTVERSNPGFGQQASGMVASALGMSAKRPGKVSLTGELVGNQLRSTNDELTPTFAPVTTALPAIGAPGTLQTSCFNIYLSKVSRADLTTNKDTVKLTRVNAVNWDIKDRRSPFYELNCAVQGPALNGEGLAGTGGFTAGANARVMNFLKSLRNGELIWVRYEALGAQIGAGPATYALVQDFCWLFNGFTELKDIGAKLLGVDVTGVIARDDNFYGSGLPGSFHTKLTNTAATLLG